ncbi:MULTISPECIES: ubiquitin-like small modifier protein 1 [Halobacterium]|nr:MULTISPECIES: ubiquitin-like small modifier protein 1 [Halobacterium]MBB6089063.1 molybdopterin synthase sulfur carrier subunit [Halobacterium salinarum]MCF2164716.1 MoaD/ThiS family protein [Halobacterium salinarum]MCF2167605.1 MoaD/ThiS family protein [Halobacterium salinarum]MCF2207089.1 MoaD/ThiS family protein [Halobacterium salinarum]MCF2239754.1 MoaD/ThiS family protein [Halobacterium salinarum]
MEWQLFADLSEVAGDDTVTVAVPTDDPTVQDALDALVADYPALGDRVLAADGSLAAHVNVLVNGVTVDADDLDTAIAAGDELAMFPPVSGG